MTELVKPSAEYNKRVAIIESLCDGRTPDEIIKFFRYPKSTNIRRCEEIRSLRGVQEGFSFSGEKSSG